MAGKIGIGWRQGEREGTITAQVVYSSRRRSLGLEIKTDGRVIVRAPEGISEEALMEFVRNRQEWILEKWFCLETKRRNLARAFPHDYEGHPELEELYRRKARTRIEQRTAYFAAEMGVTYGRISIRSAKTRWGSCSSEGNLNFHWKLVLMPPKVLDYVVVHELAHRKEMNHSRKFWAEVKNVLPDYEERRTWLKEVGGYV